MGDGAIGGVLMIGVMGFFCSYMVLVLERQALWKLDGRTRMNKVNFITGLCDGGGICRGLVGSFREVNCHNNYALG